jgi:hypothetical protein
LQNVYSENKSLSFSNKKAEDIEGSWNYYVKRMAKMKDLEEILRDHLLPVQSPDFVCWETTAKK